jgi:AcrR family transcriptional regulator
MSKVVTEGLRDAHKNRTRRALREAALKLFAARGFDAIRTEEIAAKAAVSVRTFFRYFPTKESVLFLGGRSWAESFADLFCNQPDSSPDIDAMRAALVELASDLPRSRQSLLMYKRVVATSPTLRGREQDEQNESAEQVAAAIAARRGLSRADEACQLLASIGVLIYRLSLDTWLAGPASVALGNIIVGKFGLLADQLTQTAAASRRIAAVPARRRAGESR